MITNNKQTVMKDNQQKEVLLSWPLLHWVAVDYAFTCSVL